VERPALKVATPPPPVRRSGTASAIAAAILGAAGIATLAGADDARRTFDAAGLADAALSRTLATGDPAPARAAEDALDARLRRAPLDAATRTIAASLRVESSSDPDTREQAARQALAAARLAPYDEWVARGAALVVARCGRTDDALALARGTFAYAPDEAAETLLRLEPMIPAAALERGIPDDAAAWLAWSSSLRRAGREPEADARLDALLARWPKDLGALRVAAGVAAGRERSDTIARLVPAGLALPETRDAAPLFAFRARTRSRDGDAAGARADVDRAIRLSESDPWVLALAGDALLDLDPSAARALWNRAVFALEPRGGDAVVWVRLRLARLDEREGRAADALRGWRSILAARPDSEEARRRIAELTGEPPR